jgi:uncharacterized ion transporter superfamily protein YfcC
MAAGMRLRFPHPMVLLVGGMFLAALLTWIVPAGIYDRRDDPATGRTVVIAGTYHRVPAQPVDPFHAMVDVPRGLIDAADVVFFVFLVGGAFTVVDKTGALRRAVDWLAGRLQNRRGLVIPVICTVFALGGILENLQEEIIAMVPVLLLLCRRLGFDPLTAAAMSIGAASVGSAFSPVNPFQAVIAQKIAGLPKLSGSGYRIAFLLPALAFWIWGTQRHANRVRAAAWNLPGPAEAGRIEAAIESEPGVEGVGVRSTLILLLVGVAFAVFIMGVLQWKWGFEEMAAVFFVMGIAAGIIGKLGLDGTAEAFVEGFQSMAFAALLIGFARSIYVILSDGNVVDTLVSGLFAPLAHLPVTLSAFGMMAGQTLLHFPVPSVSGQAVLTLPILVPLADLLGLSRQVVVLAYQYGAGLCELLTPTNGALMAILGAAGVRYEAWLRFALPLYLGLAALGIAALAVGVAIGLR